MTDPMDSTSFVQVGGVDSRPGNMLEIWLARTSSARLYSLLTSSDLGHSDPWTLAVGGDSRPGTGDVLSFDTPATGDRRFYRVAVNLP